MAPFMDIASVSEPILLRESFERCLPCARQRLEQGRGSPRRLLVDDFPPRFERALELEARRQLKPMADLSVQLDELHGELATTPPEAAPSKDTSE